jgi:PAS domain S-box-containing protein
MINVGGLWVLLFSEDGTLTDANDEFVRRSSYTREQLASRSLIWRDMTPAEYVGISEAQMAGLPETGHIGRYEKEFLHHDGSRSWMVFVGASLGDGTIVEYAIDIEDRKRAEERPGEEDADDAAAAIHGGALEQHIDAGAKPVFPRAALQADETVEQHRVVICRRDVNVAGFDPLLVVRRMGWERSP